MNVLKIILKILLGIIRLPFTIWYLLFGLICKAMLIFLAIMKKVGELVKDKNNYNTPEGFESFIAIITFEWASLVKIYHFKW